ncbi:hypothetical protein [Leifsonia xyli]|nr:hypothetical protein [Leifsonia xyli]
MATTQLGSGGIAAVVNSKRIVLVAVGAASCGQRRASVPTPERASHQSLHHREGTENAA